MDRLEFVRSRAQNAGRLLLAFLLVVICYSLALSGDDVFERMIGWFGAAFFGLAAVVGLRQLVRGRHAFAFDPDGMTDHANSVVIQWSEIEECAVVSVHGTKFLGLTFRNPDQFLSRISALQRMMSRLDKRMGCGHWALSFSALSPDIDAALDFIHEHAPSVRTPGGLTSRRSGRSVKTIVL